MLTVPGESMPFLLVSVAMEVLLSLQSGDGGSQVVAHKMVRELALISQKNLKEKFPRVLPQPNRQA